VQDSRVTQAGAPVRNHRIRRASPMSVDFIVALVFLVVFGVTIHAFQYHGAMAEGDLYRTLVGLMDGAISGKGIMSDLQYRRDFGFGYLAAFYTFADPATLRDPDLLMQLMNQAGFWSMLFGLLFFWCAVRLVHGSLAATVALIVFALGPMVPELATSGHQVIPMFAFLCAGGTLLFLSVTGWKAVLASTGGAVCLLLGLTMRAELFLALPWLVLSRVDTRSMRAFVVSGFLRSIAPAFALIAFLILQHHVALATGEVGNYFRESYSSWRTLAPGVIYVLLGCGFATAAGAAIAGLYLGWDTSPSRQTPAGWNWSEILGPLALIIVPFMFFLPNPAPPRHFLIMLAGMSILIGIALARRPVPGRMAALGIALGIGLANQVLSELARPVLLRLNAADSLYLPVPTEYPTTTHANVGWEWRRHAALVERRQRWNAFGDELRSLCDKYVIVLSDESEQLFSRLYAGGMPVDASRIEIYPDKIYPDTGSLRQYSTSVHMAVASQGASRLIGLMGVWRGKTFIMLEKVHIWPGDAVATIMADAKYDDYKLIADPYTLSTFDKLAIPDGRAPHFGCADWIR
jgi:hypothetical protein